MLEIEQGKNGFSVWEEDTWIIDASTLKSDGEITIDVNRFDIVYDSFEGRLTLHLKELNHVE